MTIRTDISFNMELSPRLITVAAPSTEITLQDFHDTAVDFEDSPEGHQYPRIVLSAGKEALGGGVTVGITSTMQNAQLSFEARVTDLEEGTVTTADSTGKVLIDSTALFQTNLVGRGDIIYNQTDDSKSTVLSVDSETQITHTVLIGGTDNDWDMSDAYEIYDVQQCNISGGNLVAVDDVGAELDPVFPTFGTQVVRTASSSTTAVQFDEQVQDLSDRIESIRPTHQGYGIIYYWDPENGNDTNDGLLRTTGVQSFAAAHALVSPGDTILGIPPSSGFVVDQINITKKNIQIRGTGDNFWIKPATDVVPVIFNNADFSSLSNVRISKATAGSANGINIIDSDRVLINEVNIHQETGDSVYISGSYMVHLKDSWFHGCTGNGITGVTGCNHLRVENCFISNNTGEGIDLDGTTINSTQIGWGTKIQFNSGYGINLGADPRRISIDSSVILFNNTSGDVNAIAANQVNFYRDIDNQLVNETKYLTEMQREHHTGYGDMYFWDPTNGDDNRDGRTVEKAVATFAQAHTLCQDGHHDVIVAVAASVGQTITTETIVISKNYIFLRGPGRDFLMKPVTNTAPTIEVTGVGVQIESMMVETSATGGQNAVKISGGANFFNLRYLWTKDTTGHAVYIDGTSSSIEFGIIEECTIESPGIHGIMIEDDVHQTSIINCKIVSSDDGIHLTGSQPRDIGIIGSDTQIYGQASYGINIQPNSLRTLIDNNVKIHENVGGTINDLGLSTLYADNLYQDTIVDKTWDEVLETDGNYTAKQMLQIGFAALSGEVSISGDVITFKTPDGNFTRMVSTTDSTGQRTNIALTP